MADVGDDLLDGELDETTFGELDGEEEDALLAGEDYEAYQDSVQSEYSESHGRERMNQENFMSVDQVQDVSEGDEILEEGEEDVLELAVVDELDESEMDTSQGNGQVWNEPSQPAQNLDNARMEAPSSGVSSSTHTLTAIAGESDEEENEDRGSRFKTERTNIISLKGVTSRKSLSEIPDTLDKVKTPAPTTGMRMRGGFQRGGRGGVRGRLGPNVRGGSLAGRVGYGYGPRRPTPINKIHVNPHFRGGMQPGQPGWDERLPPPPGCEGFGPPMGNHQKFQEGQWGMPPPHLHMARPMNPGPPHPGQFHNPEMFPPPQPQQMGYQEQFRPPMNSIPPHGQSGRIVQFTENSHTITVENQNFQRPAFDQNFGPPNNFPPPQNGPPPFNHNMYPPNQLVNSSQRPNFPQPPPDLTPPPSFPNYQGYPPPEFHPPPNHLPPGQFQNYDSQNAWNAPSPMEGPGPQNHFYPPGQPQPPPQVQYVGPPPQPSYQPPHPPFPNLQPNLRLSSPKQMQGNNRVPVTKRLAPRLTPNSASVPHKKPRFDHKPKPAVVNIRSNLQEIKTVDNLPDTTTVQEPEIEEDEETKQYRLKIAEQKALREKILKEKEARRLAAILEKQKKTETNNTSMTVIEPTPTSTTVVQRPAAGVRGRGRGRLSVTKVIPRQPKEPTTTAQMLSAGTPVVQIQQMLGTMYKIVKVRTKEGAIVTRKTPLVMEKPGQPAVPVKTINTATAPPRRVVLNNAVRPMGGARGGSFSAHRPANNNLRMVSSNQFHNRTLSTIQTTPMPRVGNPAPQRVVIDKRLPGPGVRVPTASPVIPLSTVVTVDNLSLSTSQQQIQKLAKQVGALSSFKHEPDLKRATIKFQKPKEAEQFYLKFHRKMIDLSRISVTVVPE